MTAEDFLGFLEAETRRIGFESRAHSGVQHLLGGLRSHPVMEIVPNKARSLSLSLRVSGSGPPGPLRPGPGFKVAIPSPVCMFITVGPMKKL